MGRHAEQKAPYGVRVKPAPLSWVVVGVASTAGAVGQTEPIVEPRSDTQPLMQFSIETLEL